MNQISTKLILSVNVLPVELRIFSMKPNGLNNYLRLNEFYHLRVRILLAGLNYSLVMNLPDLPDKFLKLRIVKRTKIRSKD